MYLKIPVCMIYQYILGTLYMQFLNEMILFDTAWEVYWFESCCGIRGR